MSYGRLKRALLVYHLYARILPVAGGQRLYSLAEDPLSTHNGTLIANIDVLVV